MYSCYLFKFQGVLVGKDAEIAEQQGIINDLQQQLQAARMDTDKNAIGELMQVNWQHSIFYRNRLLLTL